MGRPNSSRNRFPPTTPHLPGLRTPPDGQHDRAVPRCCAPPLCPAAVLSPGHLFSPGLRHRLFTLAPTSLSPAPMLRGCTRNTQRDRQTPAHLSQARLSAISPHTCLPSRRGLTTHPWLGRHLKVILNILRPPSPCSSHPAPKFSFKFISPLLLPCAVPQGTWSPSPAWLNEFPALFR